MELLNNPFASSEDDVLRSIYIYELVSKETQVNNNHIDSTIPRVIIQFWHNAKEIPTDVQECLDSWKLLDNIGFKRLLFNESTAREFILTEMNDSHLRAFDKCHHPAMKCDYFRLCYLLAYGGFYVDADEVYLGTEISHFFLDNSLKFQPLCYDNNNEKMVKAEVFMNKREYSPHWTYYVNNNPLITPANHPVICLALDRATSIILNAPLEQLEIQSTTGPGNLTASLVRHSITCKLNNQNSNFSILSNWDDISISKWPLSYRNDERNWRLWKPSKLKNKEN